LHHHNFRCFNSFQAPDQLVADCACAVSVPFLKNLAPVTGSFDAGPFRASLLSVNKGGTDVDLALKLNVLAVCAVFAFVGAILLGAF
jgi:hypothetical protein